MEQRKHDILQTLEAHVNQRPGLEFANYGDVKAYRSDYRRILQNKHDFETLLKAILWRDSLTADDLIAATSAYSGRLQINEGKDRRVEVEYCPGQYYPTEYRAAACAVLASALWGYMRSRVYIRSSNDNGPMIRDRARAEFGRGIASRWFN